MLYVRSSQPGLAHLWAPRASVDQASGFGRVKKGRRCFGLRDAWKGVCLSISSCCVLRAGRRRSCCCMSPCSCIHDAMVHRPPSPGRPRVTTNRFVSFPIADAVESAEVDDYRRVSSQMNFVREARFRPPSDCHCPRQLCHSSMGVGSIFSPTTSEKIVALVNIRRHARRSRRRSRVFQFPFHMCLPRQSTILHKPSPRGAGYPPSSKGWNFLYMDRL